MTREMVERMSMGIETLKAVVWSTLVWLESAPVSSYIAARLSTTGAPRIGAESLPIHLCIV